MENEELLEENRKKQKKLWLEQTLTTELLQRIRGDKRVKMHLHELEQQVIDNKITPTQAVDNVMRAIFGDK